MTIGTGNWKWERELEIGNWEARSSCEWNEVQLYKLAIRKRLLYLIPIN
ncbi:hypothetical protein OSCI_3510012 [Kamptonema sp. PCC 6506]|nr:hypothetical protein OSCI_3510012 [Kamptonema sp. PCC 6506]